MRLGQAVKFSTQQADGTWTVITGRVDKLERLADPERIEFELTDVKVDWVELWKLSARALGAADRGRHG